MRRPATEADRNHLRLGLALTTFILLTLVATGTAYLVGTVSELSSRVEQLRDTTMETLTATWVDADGVTHTVDTPRRPEERLADWIARHKETVDALKEVFPPAGD